MGNNSRSGMCSARDGQEKRLSRVFARIYVHARVRRVESRRFRRTERADLEIMQIRGGGCRASRQKYSFRTLLSRFNRLIFEPSPSPPTAFSMSI